MSGKCDKCGDNVPEDASYCPNCGEKTEKDNSAIGCVCLLILAGITWLIVRYWRIFVLATVVLGILGVL